MAISPFGLIRPKSMYSLFRAASLLVYRTRPLLSSIDDEKTYVLGFSAEYGLHTPLAYVDLLSLVDAPFL